MNTRLALRCTLLSVALLFWGCLKGPVAYTTRDYVVVKTTPSDTLESLAGKYLNDSRKAWVIADFNKIDETTPGQSVIIPLSPFNLGGLGPDGYQRVPVLAYDRLTPVGSLTDAATDLDFEQQMDYLKRNHYNVIGLDRLLDFMDYRSQIPEKTVVITIDDNSRAVMDAALPSLMKYGFPATLFVDTATLGKEGMLTVNDLKGLNEKGLEIQCRSGWEIDGAIETRKISLEQYFERIKKEIPKAQALLERATGFPCSVYACPPAGANNLLIEFLKRSGFKAALVTNGQANPFYADPFHIGRTPVSSVCPPGDFSHKLNVFKSMELN